MQVEYTLTEDELFAFQLHYVVNSRMYQRARRIDRRAGVIALVVTVVVMGYFGWPAGHGWVELISLLGGCAGGVLLLSTLRRWKRRQMERRIRAFVREGKPRSAGIVALDQEGVATRGGDHEGRIRWSGIEKVERLSSLLLLWYSRQAAVIVPDRAFESAATTEAFEREARAYWEQARVAAPAP